MENLQLVPFCLNSVNKYRGGDDDQESIIIHHVIKTGKLIIEYGGMGSRHDVNPLTGQNIVHIKGPTFKTYENVKFDKFLKVYDMLDFDEFVEGIESGAIGDYIKR